MSINWKRILHRHKYETLDMYPPRPKYNSRKCGFLLGCECGHTKLLGLHNIKHVNEVHSDFEYGKIKTQINDVTTRRYWELINAVENIYPGELADMILDGRACKWCGVYIDSNKPGYPRVCRDCQSEKKEGDKTA